MNINKYSSFNFVSSLFSGTPPAYIYIYIYILKKGQFVDAIVVREQTPHTCTYGAGLFLSWKKCYFFYARVGALPTYEAVCSSTRTHM
jgi:predicted AlkP superfamily pyrophosphatase or phosphodiesterase